MESESTPEAEKSLQRSEERSHEIEAEIASDPAGFRLLTGDRPTGRLHIGHYFGSLQNRVRLQNSGIKTFLIVADYLAAGIDPERTVIFTHSAVTALNQLMLPFLALVTDAELRRNPTVKDELAASNRPMSGLMLTFPVHQAADILFCKANLVPVGKDQLPHVEQTRVIARRFDERYGRVDPAHPIFPEPESLLSRSGTILGLDGNKMSKSRGNTIELGMTADETAKLLKRAVTDSDRHITYDPVNRPEVSNLVNIAAMCLDRTPEDVAEEIGDGGGGGLKKLATAAVNDHFAAHRARRAELMADPGTLRDVLRAGNERANAVAEATLAEVRQAMSMDY